MHIARRDQLEQYHSAGSLSRGRLKRNTLALSIASLLQHFGRRHTRTHRFDTGSTVLCNERLGNVVAEAHSPGQSCFGDPIQLAVSYQDSPREQS